MKTDIFDYFYWRGDLPLEANEFNELDSVILARLSYLPFEKVMERSSTTALNMVDATKALLECPNIENLVLMKEDVRLLKAISESERFQNMKILMYVNQLDAKTQTQFSAITIRLSEYCAYISFRGTDDTLVGWKEDFNMSFVCPVPAQEFAVEYVEHMASQIKGNFIFGGHSKGGNLAVYAAAFCNHSCQSRIETVYNFDGPGFDNKVLQTDGYKRICGIVNTFVPQSSIVGMMLEHEEKYKIVHSGQLTGMLQHDIYSWEAARDCFVCLTTVTNSSKFIDYTLKEWVAKLDSSQREKFIDTIYTVMAETKANTLQELGDNWLINAKTVLQSIKNLDDETRLAVAQTLAQLVKSAFSGMFQIFQHR